MNKSIITLLLVFLFSSNVFAQKNNDELNYALIAAAANGQTDSLIRILKQYPNIDFFDVNNGTALFYAAQNNHLDIVKILLYNGADPDYSLNNGFTPLMTACYNGFFDVAEYLAANGAQLDFRDDYWATALHYSVAMGDYYMTDMLLFYGANAHMLTYEKTSTLLEASLVGDTAIASLLLKKDVDIDQENKLGYSPLSVAVQNNDTVMFDFLIDHGAKVKLLQKKYYTPYAWALLNGNVYAYQKLKPERFSMQSMDNNRYNTLNIAYASEDKDLIQSIKNEGVRSGWIPYFNGALLKFSTAFNGNDAFFNFGLGLQDVKYQMDFIVNYGTRFKRKAVLHQESPDVFLQLWEHRRFVEVYLQKRFVFQFDVLDFSVYGGLGAQFMFGSYDGVKRDIKPSFVLVPQLGIQVDIKPIYFNIGYQYTPYELYDISSHKFSLGIGYRINFVNKPSKYELPWI